MNYFWFGLCLCLGLFGAAISIPHVSVDQESVAASFIYDGSTGSYRIQDSLLSDHQDVIAVATLEPTMNVTGWDVLNVKTLGHPNDSLSMFAAGYLEGYLTFKQIMDTYNSIAPMYFSGTTTLPPELISFIEEQDQWMRSMIAANPNDSFWRQTSYVLAQYDGLRAAIKDKGEKNPHVAAVTNLVGDLLDLMPALFPDQRLNWNGLSKADFSIKLAMSGHCSALIRITDDYKDLFIGQSAWFTYSVMLRIYKHYHFALHDASTAATVTSFSSYPGMLESLDDFYLMNSGLAMIQTTNPILDVSLYEKVTSKSLFAWHRVRIANAMAKTGQQWYEAVSKFNSGTYNNQYMIVNLNLFQPAQPLPLDSLWVVEQVPGYVEGADVTELLRLGYWASYNVPFFPKIYDISGFPAAVQKYGADMSYTLCPRAKIFRRDHSTVNSYEEFKQIMRSNNYETDPFAEGSPFNAVCSRGDLAHPASLGSCYDAKVTSYQRALKMQSDAINGPTRGANGTQYPPFVWLPQYNSTKHFGQPKTFDFQYVEMQPKL